MCLWIFNILIFIIVCVCVRVCVIIIVYNTCVCACKLFVCTLYSSPYASVFIDKCLWIYNILIFIIIYLYTVYIHNTVKPYLLKVEFNQKVCIYLSQHICPSWHLEFCFTFPAQVDSFIMKLYCTGAMVAKWCVCLHPKTVVLVESTQDLVYPTSGILGLS